MQIDKSKLGNQDTKKSQKARSDFQKAVAKARRKLQKSILWKYV